MSEEDSEHKHKIRDWWDKLDIISKFVTAGLVTLITIFGTSYLNKQQDATRSSQLYSQFMSEREKAENQVRKDMFEKVLAEFWHKPDEKACILDVIDQQLLQLELISRNFHETLDLSPLFSHVLLKIVRNINTKTLKFEYAGAVEKNVPADKLMEIKCSNKAYGRLLREYKKKNKPKTEIDAEAVKNHIKRLKVVNKNKLVSIARRITNKQMESLSDVVKRVRFEVKLDRTCTNIKPNERVSDKEPCELINESGDRKILARDEFESLNAVSVKNEEKYNKCCEVSSRMKKPHEKAILLSIDKETKREFWVKVRRAYPRWSRVYMEIETNRSETEQLADPGDGHYHSANFWVSYFDFPLADNTYLSNKERFSVVLENIDEEENTAEISLLYFPASYAGFKEKAFYQQRMLNSLLNKK